jgi:MFS transporter, DHA1 family, inner membrane transport protein
MSAAAPEAPLPLPPVPWRILPAIALSQFASTSLWFALNAVLPDLQARSDLPEAAAGWLTSAVQVGFIAGTLVFALLAVADRFSPRKVFTLCSLLGAALALATLMLPTTLTVLVVLRFATGFVLAGIYPVGMKIASGWYAGGLGWALGVLVGALVLGTAAPFGLRALGASWPWEQVMVVVALFAAAGGALMAAAVPDGPYLRRAPRIDPRALSVLWRDPPVRASAFGYFGHMWELYAFFVLVPLIVAHRLPQASLATQSGWVFAVIAMGAVACVAGGVLVRRVGGARVATVLLATGAVCGLVSPWMLDAPLPLWAAWILLWGFAVAGDSPQFSALTAQNAPREWVGSVLTFSNSIGFALSVLTILGFVAAVQRFGLAPVLPWLAVGPIVGVWVMRPLWRAAR